MTPLTQTAPAVAKVENKIARPLEMKIFIPSAWASLSPMDKTLRRHLMNTSPKTPTDIGMEESKMSKNLAEAKLPISQLYLAAVHKEARYLSNDINEEDCRNNNPSQNQHYCRCSFIGIPD